MPNQMMVAQANGMLSSASMVRLLRENRKAYERLAEPETLVEVARDVLELDREGLDYLSAMPSAVQEAIRAAIYDALTEREEKPGVPAKPAKPVQLSYMPSYDYGVTVVDYGQAVTIQVSGPYTASSPQEKAAHMKGTAARGSGARKPARRKASVRKTGAKRPRRRGR